MSRSVGYLPTLDGVRFFAFLLVFFHHLEPGPGALLQFVHRYGWVGVHIFLLLSAYLLARILVGESARWGKIRLGAFFLRRILRIWPLYFLACFAAFAWSLHVSGWTPGNAVRLGTALAFVDNVIATVHGYSPLPYAAHLWTISLEEQFYVVLPFVLGFALRRRERLGGAMLGIWVGFLTARAACAWANAPGLLVWVSLFSADSLVLGTLLGATGWRPPSHGIVRGGIATLAVGGLAAAGLFPGVGSPGWHQVPLFSVVAVGAACLLLVALHEPSLAFLGREPLRYLGRISFGLYVFHIAGIYLGAWILERWHVTTWLAHAWLSLALTVAIAALSYELIEKRFLRLKRRFETFHARPV